LLDELLCGGDLLSTFLMRHEIKISNKKYGEIIKHKRGAIK
jgi:hypothetical protein